ncbi:MAG: hypothetical protein ACLP5V_15875 [Candidatus Bathyarchaeia archaeon]
MRLNPSDELRFPDYRVLRFLLEHPSATKYTIEHELAKVKILGGEKAPWSHGTLYDAITRLKDLHLIQTARPEERRPGHDVELYELTLPGFFRALRSSVLSNLKFDMATIAGKNSKLLPEILGQWSIFEENGVGGLAESRLITVALDTWTQVGMGRIMDYRHYYRGRRLPGHLKRLLQEERVITKARVMRIFLFGSIQDEPFPTSWGNLNWTSSLQKSPGLKKWAIRIARADMNRYKMATARWKNVLSELEALKPTPN